MENSNHTGARVFFSDFFIRSSEGKKIALIAMFTALAVIANALSIDISPSQKITFTYLVGFFAGTFFGGVIGFVVMLLGDVIGFLINSGGGIFWFPLSLTTALLAFIPGIIMNAVRFRFKGGVFLKAAIAMLAAYVFVTCFSGALANYTYVKYVYYAGREYGTLFSAYLIGKIGFSSIVAWLNYALCFAIIPIINSNKGLKLKIE